MKKIVFFLLVEFGFKYFVKSNENDHLWWLVRHTLDSASSLTCPLVNYLWAFPKLKTNNQQKKFLFGPQLEGGRLFSFPTFEIFWLTDSQFLTFVFQWWRFGVCWISSNECLSCLGSKKNDVEIEPANKKLLKR